MATDAHVPTVLWAERADRLFLTVEIADAQEPKVDVLDEGVVTVAARGGADGATRYELRLELLHPVLAKARAARRSGARSHERAPKNATLLVSRAGERMRAALTRWRACRRRR